MIYFKTIKWKNFLSTGNIFTTIHLNKNKTTLIVGENGSGKSTILDALSFVLYNKPFRKINKPQLVNSITNKEMVVEIEFESNQANYKIVRGMKPTVFEIYKNGNLLNQDASSKDYQEFLERNILKINHKSFCQVVVLGSASFTPFMQLTAQARREVIEDLLDLEIFTKMNVALKSSAAANKTELAECSSEKKSIQTKIEMTKLHMNKLKENKEKQKNDKEEKIKELNGLIINTATEIEALVEKLQDLQSEIKDESATKKKLDQNQKYKIQLSAEIDRDEDTTKFFQTNDMCPTCTQKIDEDFKQKIKDKRSTIRQTINKAIEKLDIEKKELDKKMEYFSSVNDSIYKINMSLSVLNSKNLGYNDQIKQLKKEIKELDDDQKVIDENKINEYEEEYKKLEEKYNDLMDQQSMYSSIGLILKDSGIKAKIIKQYISVINTFINKYLSSMDFFVNFELNESFEEKIKSRFRDEFSYASFSEGEKMRINLAVLFTWRAVSKMRNSVNTNLLIMDEVFDSSLDSSGTDEFLKLIQDLSGGTNTFIISHKTDQLVDKFEKIIKFQKRKNFSRIAA